MLTWLDWERADMQLAAYVGRLAQLRRDLTQWDDAYLSEDNESADFNARAQWCRVDGHAKSVSDWDNSDCFALLCSIGRGIALERTLLAFNRAWNPCQVTPPPPRVGYEWALALDSARAGEAELLFTSELAARSVTLLIERPLV